MSLSLTDPMKKTLVGITVVGKDKEGIVASFTNFVFERKGNLEKVNQNVIKGLFGMYLEASFTKKLDIKKFDSDLQRLAKKLKMEVSSHHETNSQKNIAIFVTKEPHCLDSFLHDNRKKNLKGKISVIIGTEKTLSSKVKSLPIPFVVIDERNQEKAETKILQICKKYDVDLIILARYMRIHPSLLPAFPGALAYEQAFERGTKI